MTYVPTFMKTDIYKINKVLYQSSERNLIRYYLQCKKLINTEIQLYTSALAV